MLHTCCCGSEVSGTVGGLLGSSSPGFPGTHSPGTPDLGGHLLHLCGMTDASIPHAHEGPRVVTSGKGCTFRCGWVSDTLIQQV